MFRLPRSIGQTLVPVLGFVIFANMGCATSIATQYPHLDRRSVCVLPPEIEKDSTEWIYTDNNIPISNDHPDIVEQVAPTARTVFEYDPHADPDSVRYLPAPHNELQCPQRFSILPSRDAQTLPDASMDLLVHERRPEIVPRPVAEKLASCPSQSSGPLKPMAYTMTFNVYVTNEGRAVSAVVAQSTLGDRNTEACMVDALQKTLWPVDETAAKATSAQAGASTVSPASKLFFGQPAPVVPPPDFGDRPSGIYPKQAPQGVPGELPIPRIFVIPLSPLAAGAAVFGIIYFWSSEDAPPAWRDELNPITRQPYTSEAEHEQVSRLSLEEILAAQRAHTKATQPQPPPAPAPTPVPAPATTTATNNRDRWQCSASCNVQQINPKVVCPARVTGSAGGPNEPAACVEAKRSATQSTPAGCYPRHCQCRCSRR